MNVPAFVHLEARSVEEAQRLLAQHGQEGKIIAGGTDVLVKMKLRRLLPRYLINIKGIPNLDYIRYDEGEGLRIGALASIESVRGSLVVRRHYPMLQKAAAYMATVEIRNRATVVGNICNGSPSAETAPGLIALGAKARIVGAAGERVVPVEEFFLGPSRTVLQPDEMVLEVVVPEPPKGSGGAYEKYSLRRMDVAMVGAAALIVPSDTAIGDIKIVLSAVAPTPIRARKAEEVLRGHVPTQALVDQAALAAMEEARPISDIRGTAEVRRSVVGVLTTNVIQQALKAANLRCV